MTTSDPRGSGENGSSPGTGAALGPAATVADVRSEAGAASDEDATTTVSVEEIGFFHLTRSPLERALPRLLQQLLARDEWVFLKCADAEMAETLDRFLWAFDPDSFLPHGRVGEGREADQPILIGWEDIAPANGAPVAVVVAPADLPAAPVACRFRRIAYLFDGHDEAIVARARATYRAAAALTRVRKYWRQDQKGRWQLVNQ